jgi:hypothetical protein
MAEGVGADRAEVRLTAEQVCDAGVIADSHTNLLDNILLYDDIAEIDDIEIADIAEIEIADIAGDRAEVRLTADQVCDAGVIADSHTNLFDNILLYDDIAEIEIPPSPLPLVYTIIRQRKAA